MPRPRESVMVAAHVLLLTLVLHVVHGIQPSDTVPAYLAKYGIEVQEQTVITEDGYILTLFRIPRPGAPVVLFQHGILSSAWCWIDNDPVLAPALQVYKMGYDVWLSNSRGNTYSRKHVSLDSSFSKAYWNFSFSTMGRYDVPSNIDHVLAQTGKAQLTYVGHAQGTSQFFAAMTDKHTKAHLEKSVNVFIALAPVTYMSHQKAELFSVLGSLHLADLVESAFPYGFLEWSTMSIVSKTLCTLTGGILCKIGVDVVCGQSPEDTAEAITNISAHFPAGTSVLSIDHYEQLTSSGKFCDFDYGKHGNLRAYNQTTPPNFDLTEARVPTALFIGSHDDLGDTIDEERAASELPKSTLVFKEVFPDFSHITWIAGTWSSFQAWFPKFQSLLAKYNPTDVLV